MTDELRDRWLQAEREEAAKVRADRDRLSAELAAREQAELFELDQLRSDRDRLSAEVEWLKAHAGEAAWAELQRARAQLQAVAKLAALFNDWAKPGINRAARDMAEMCARELAAALETPPRGIVNDSFIPSLHMPPLATEPPPPSGEAVCPECKGYLHPRSCPACHGTGRTPAGTSPALSREDEQYATMPCTNGRHLELIRGLRQKLAAEQQAREAAEARLADVEYSLRLAQTAQNHEQVARCEAERSLLAAEQARAKAESELAAERSRYYCRHPEVCWNPNHPEYEEDK